MQTKAQSNLNNIFETQTLWAGEKYNNPSFSFVRQQLPANKSLPRIQKNCLLG
jgi:hypothetical protein